MRDNHFLKTNAKMMASETGFERARYDFVQGRRFIYEIKFFTQSSEGTVPTDGISQPTGRYDGPFEIRAMLTCADFPAVWTEIRRSFIESYNQHMHQLYEKPELFDANGFRVVHQKISSGVAVTNGK
jgi:hypothetical protein